MQTRIHTGSWRALRRHCSSARETRALSRRRGRRGWVYCCCCSRTAACCCRRWRAYRPSSALLGWRRSCGGVAAGVGGAMAECGRRLCRKLEALWRGGEIDNTWGGASKDGGTVGIKYLRQRQRRLAPSSSQLGRQNSTALTSRNSCIHAGGLLCRWSAHAGILLEVG
jgi:hypothetical protein